MLLVRVQSGLLIVGVVEARWTLTPKALVRFQHGLQGYSSVVEPRSDKAQVVRSNRTIPMMGYNLMEKSRSYMPLFWVRFPVAL